MPETGSLRPLALRLGVSDAEKCKRLRATTERMGQYQTTGVERIYTWPGTSQDLSSEQIAMPYTLVCDTKVYRLHSALHVLDV